MDNKPKSPPLSILFVWMMVIILITSAVSAVFTAILVYYRSKDIMEAADARLLIAAEMSREIVGPDYHNQIDGLSSVSEEQFVRIVERNDNLCRRLGLQYLWSVLQVHNNMLVFTSATHSDINDSTSPYASFFETHRDPQAFAQAMGPEMKPSFSSFHNEWGEGRMVLVPRKDSRGRTYIFGASIRLTEYEAIVRQSLLAALAIWLGVMCVAFPAALALSHRLISPIAELTNAADRMASGDLDAPLPSSGTRELQSLCRSFDRMRRELKQQTEELRENEYRYRGLLFRLPIGVYRNTPGQSGRFIMANEAIAKMFGYESPEIFIQTNVSDLYMDSAEREAFSKQLSIQGGVDAVMLRLKKKDGSPFWASVTARVVHNNQGEIEYFDGIIEDVTERKQVELALRESEEKLARSKKMESMGLLAGGVAHDLNNVLSGIVSYPELILMDLPEDSNLRKPIETMQESGHRAAAIVQDLLTVARGVATTKEPLNINDMIGDYLHSPEFNKLKQFYPTVTVKTTLDSDLLNLGGSSVHIRKVVMNLVSNALEAVEGGGNVTISTMNRYVDRPLRGYDDVNIGEYVVLSVSDDGPGISSDDLERIFEPFYTKKVMGRSGTGLGLAVVWNSVQDHNGYIDVTTDENGTIFELYFPITRDEISDKAFAIPIKDYKGNGETILVVDDIESQREISCKMLDTLGYQTKAVSSGEEAVEYLREHTVDLILLDMIMDSGINGRETYERIVKIHPNQKAIIVSGFAETDDVAEAQKLGAGSYLKKPLTLEKAGIALREELKK